MILTLNVTRKGYEVSLGRRAGVAKVAVLYPAIADGLLRVKSAGQVTQERACPLSLSVASAHGGLWRLGGVDVAMTEETVASIASMMKRFEDIPSAHNPSQKEMFDDPVNAQALEAIREQFGEWFFQTLNPPRGGWAVALAVPGDKYAEAKAVGAFDIPGLIVTKEIPRDCEWIYTIQSRMDSSFRESINQIKAASPASAYAKAEKLANMFDACAKQFSVNCGSSVNNSVSIVAPIAEIVRMLKTQIGIWSSYKRLMVTSFINAVEKEYQKIALVKATKIWYTDDGGELCSAPLSDFLAPWDPMNTYAIAAGGGVEADISSAEFDDL